MMFVVGLGSSDVHAGARVKDGVARIDAHPALRVIAVSGAYESPAAGDGTTARFVNAAVVVDTALGARALLAELHAIERAAGRIRNAHTAANASRTLDLDLLFAVAGVAHAAPVAADSVDADAGNGGGPVLPHPRFLERAFAVIPAVDALRRAHLPISARLDDAARRLTGAPLFARDDEAIARP